MNTIDALFDAAFAEHQAGNLSEAQALYFRVLQARPLHADALHLMGVLVFQHGQLDLAEKLIQTAIEVKPSAGYCGNLGLVHFTTGKIDDAIAAYQKAIALRPSFAEAHNNLANALRHLGRLDEALEGYRQAIVHRDDFFEAHNNLGLSLSQLGRIDEAIASFTRAIELQPQSAEARSSLGIAYTKAGQWQRAIDCFRESLSLRPESPPALNNLGNALKQAGQTDEAIATFRRALRLQPSLAEAHNNLGVIHFDRGEVELAIESYRAALAAQGEFADAHYNLAIALHFTGEVTGAIASCRRALACRGDWPAAHNNLGIWLGETGRGDEALAAFDAAIASQPDYSEAHNNRGNILRQLGRLSEAVGAYQTALDLRKDDVKAWVNLGVVQRQLAMLDEALTAFETAIEISPDLAEAYTNLGNLQRDQGELDAALKSYNRALALRPDDSAIASNRVYTLYFHPHYLPSEILAEHERWSRQFAEPFQSSILPHDVQDSSDRPLRIGYIAPDFREHCQSFFTLPLLSHHDRQRFQIHCYSDCVSPDAMTERLISHADVWRNIAGQNDAKVASQIRNDKIDILVDLTLHMSHNRLTVFAQKPAPIQVSWLGYPGTTGLETIDYRISDPHLDPPGNDSHYTERTIRLPETFWCYDPLTTEPAVGELPLLGNGIVTFGCLNNFCKINDGVLKLWARVMRATRPSRLLLLAPEGKPRRRVLETFAGEGIDPTRIFFSGRVSRRRYLELYHLIDIGLDTFPYNGHTTSLDAMWMGVPIITRVGETAVGRGGLSQLSNLGLEELAAENDGQFVEIASRLARDRSRLRQLRGTLRQRMMHSPLMDGARFARNVEEAYQAMWNARANAAPLETVEGERLRMHITNAVQRRRGAPLTLAS